MVVHLGERDCSLQRKIKRLSKKLIHSFFLNSEEKWGSSCSCRCEQSAIKTQERLSFGDKKTFLFHGNEYAIQVEHPITEMTWMWILCKQQIKIRLTIRNICYYQEDITSKRAKIECRLNAENYLKASVLLQAKTFYTNLLRYAGRFVITSTAWWYHPPFYDSMLTKLIAW